MMPTIIHVVYSHERSFRVPGKRIEVTMADNRPMHVSSAHLRGETMTYCVPSACKLSFMPQFKIVEVRACDPVLWLATWAAEYGGSAGFDEDEYAQLIA